MKPIIKMKKERALVLVTVLIGLLSVSQGDVYEVRTAQDLMKLFEGVSGTTLTSHVVLLSDLDFSTSGLTLPLGASSNGNCVAFSGVFQGNGHSIKNLAMHNKNNGGYKNAGLFCSLKNATVENVIIDSSCSFSGCFA